jgi:hypothetical protein
MAIERLTFQVLSFSVIPDDDGDENTPGAALFEDIAPPATLTTFFPGSGRGMASGAVTVPPGATAAVPVPFASLSPTFGSLGWMIVTHDDPNGPPQADLVPR